jgi:iron complex transport system ATP-binding protein
VLCQDTDYALFDEPLNNLDMRHASAMMRLLRRAADEFGKTIVLVLHDINFASCYSDTIVAMRNGEVAFQGTPDEVMREDVLTGIFETEIEIHDVADRRIAVFY